MNIQIEGETDHTSTLVIPAQSKHLILLNMVERFTSRKFIVCVFLEICSTVAAFKGIIEPGTWLAFGTLVLGTYCGASIADKNFNGGNG